ncbi:MAG: hypothetical protein JJE36_03775 [Coriobacteriia bacterium]|nr:hypothetical protein [Coriobacteriia bacterium]
MLRLFKNDEGSTALTVVVSIVLVVVLVAFSMQWYWVNSSSADVQFMADMGAVGAADAIAKTVSVIQVIDAVMMSLNLFGLVIHATVLVAGVASVVGAPVGGAAMAPFLERSVAFDKDFVEARRKFSDAVYGAAQKISDAAPYLALGYASNLVAQNASARDSFNKSSYHVITIPFPAKGVVTRSDFSETEGELVSSIEKTSNSNKTDATDLKVLDEKLQTAIDECYSADIYKAIGVPRARWNPSQSLADFKGEFEKVAAQVQGVGYSANPIDESSQSARLSLEEIYNRDLKSVTDSVRSRVQDAIGEEPVADGPMTSVQVDIDELYRVWSEQQVYLLEHETGRRKAYHCDQECSGLANASEVLQTVDISAVYGDADHPPCSVCRPFSWAAVQSWRQNSSSFLEAWNSEASAIRSYEEIRALIKEKSQGMQERTRNGFDELLKAAEKYLKGGRLTYEPAGSRGILCIAYASGGRAMPGFTLSEITNTENVELGPQVALAASKIMPAKGLYDIKAGVSTTNNYLSSDSGRLGGLIYNSIDGDDSMFGALSSIWVKCTQVFTNSDKSLSRMFSSLPWGIGAIADSFMSKLIALAGVEPPDMRSYKPFLVNTATIGDPSRPDAEGRFFTALRASKKALEQSGGLNATGLKEVISESVSGYETDAGSRIRNVLPVAASGNAINLPFHINYSQVVQTSVMWLKSNVLLVLSAIPDGS